jgi:DNA invertase Pin-like site-specific DNA recombinase
LRAAKDRELIRERTGAGRERAKARGTKFDPKLKLNSSRPVIASTGEPQSAMARLLNVDQSTISRLARAASQSRVKLGA